jgi:nicotinamide-nucleotide amidase
MMETPSAEIVAIGSELLLGQIVDTNSSHIAARLAQIGIEVARTSTVGDDFHRMEDILAEATRRASILITTGGLGPTEDDLTREAIARVAGRPLVLDPDLVAQIEAWFKRRGFRMTENNRKQAYLPEGAIPVENPVGTAPAFIVENPGCVTISLPGVPREMKYLLEHRIVPYLRSRFELKSKIIRYRVLRTCGLGESGVGLQIQDLMRESKNPAVGTLASPGDVRIRITATAEDPEKADTLIAATEEEIRKRLGKLIYGMDEETLQGNIARDLKRLNLTLGIVETFTGGNVLQKLTGTEHSSSFHGVVLPSDHTRERFLGLDRGCFTELRTRPPELLELLSRKAREMFRSDWILTQYSGEIERHREEEYRMTSFHCLSTPEGIIHEEHVLGGEPALLRERASILSLDLVRKHLLR